MSKKKLLGKTLILIIAALTISLVVWMTPWTNTTQVVTGVAVARYGVADNYSYAVDTGTGVVEGQGLSVRNTVAADVTFTPQKTIATVRYSGKDEGLILMASCLIALILIISCGFLFDLFEKD